MAINEHRQNECMLTDGYRPPADACVRETRINKDIDSLKWYNKPIPYIDPILTFIGFGFWSIVIGFIGGFQLWIWSGATPDTSGGTGIFFYGAIVGGLITLASRLLTRRRAILYGLFFFTLLTACLLILLLISNQTG
jgi:hypothetical protein